MASQYRRRSLMLNTIAKVAQGNPTIITDSSSRRLQKLNIYGQSEQDSTTGKNLLDVSKIDKFESYSNGRISNFGTLPKGSYVISMGNISADSRKDGYFAIEVGTFSYWFIHPTGANPTLPKGVPFTIEEDTTLSANIHISTQEQFESFMSLLKDTIQIESGGTKTSWEPYTGGKPSPSLDYEQEIISKEVSEIKVTGANLIKYPFYNGNRVIKGVTFTVNDDQSITINGTNDGTGDSKFSININDRFKKGDAISTGLLSDKDDANVYVDTYYIGEIGINSKKENIIVDDDSKNYNMLLSVRSGATIDNVTVKLMRNYGPTLLPYEPYKEQIVNLTSPITLRGIPVNNGGNVTIDGKQYFSDVIKEKDGVIGVERNIAHYEITGNENVMKFADGTFFYISNLPRKSLSSDNGLCTHCKYLYIGRGNDKVGICVAQRSATCRFNLELETVEEYKAMFKQAYDEGNPFKVDYHAEPTFEPLPEEVQAQYKALKSYYPNTVIDTGCWNEVTYSAKRGG